MPHSETAYPCAKGGIMSADRDAAALVQEHGDRAPQLLVDQLVHAVRAGDEGRITMLDKLLRAVDALLLDGARHSQASAASALMFDKDFPAKCANG
jgi:hypothetical protein